MWNKLLVIITLCVMVSCSEPAYKNPHVKIKTGFGEIELELFIDNAPKTVAAFLSYIDSGFYKNASFYRVLNLSNQPSANFKAELIQGGLWKKNRKRWEAIPGIPHESTYQTKILHKDGVISMARLAPGTAKAEFFICIGDQPGFDFGGENNADGQGYAAFGKVINGMNTVRKIYDQPEYEQSFDPPVNIYNIVR